MTRTKRRPLDIHRLQKELHDQYVRANKIPSHHIIGRKALQPLVHIEGGEAALASKTLEREGIQVRWFEPILADVNYHRFQTRAAEEGLNKNTVEERIHQLGGISRKNITVSRTGLRLAKLLSWRDDAGVYLVLGNVESAKGKRGEDVTAELQEQHSIIANEFGDPAYHGPILHFGAVTFPAGISTGELIEDFLPEQLGSIVPEQITLPPVRLVELPPLPD